MSAPLLDALVTRHGLPLIGAAEIDAFLAPATGEPPHTVLFFTGDPAQRGETNDVAVVLPQLLAQFAGRLRGGVISRAAEDALRGRFHVIVYPSLVVTRAGEMLGVIAKIKDWSDYVTQIGEWLEPDAPVMAAGQGPRTQITRSGRSIEA
jgi:hydrogenase-1 operon protein HyaE